MIMRRQIIGKIILFLIPVLLYCTNPFSTREPEPPDFGNDFPRSLLQTDPDSVLSKIQRAFRTRNAQMYKECLAAPEITDTLFRFIPERDEAPRLLNWTLEDEFTYFTNLANDEDVKSVNIDFTERKSFTEVPSRPDLREGPFNYRIILLLNSDPNPQIYRGRSNLRLIKASNELWYIFEWQDFKIEGENSGNTWSTLKANYRF